MYYKNTTSDKIIQTVLISSVVKDCLRVFFFERWASKILVAG